ncbi:MAG: hypothetical protein ABIR55_09950 [Burkholderiaceae bacterium]
MNQPSPAIVAQGAVRRLPRLALLLLCLAYVVPGMLGREPWRNADMAVFGYMLDMAHGLTSWLDPQMLGLRPEADGLLPYWIGAWAVEASPPWLSPALAARVPFALMLALTLTATWYAVYNLALQPHAQPVAFAFGGEADPTDYARAIGDGGLLALIACLGLAQPTHEATTHVALLCFCALTFYATAALGRQMVQPAVALALGLSGLVLSGAPTLAVLFGGGGALLHLLAADNGAGGRRRALRAAGLLALLTVLAAALASSLDLWRWRIVLPTDADSKDWRSMGRLLLWFTWPAWPLMLWTVWRWRRQIWTSQINLHLALPLWFAAVTIGAALSTKPADRALLLALPALATLAAFALPTLRRSVAALIDWFTLLFFTGCGIVIWVIWFAMQTGIPRQAAVNVFKQAPDFHASFGWPGFAIALSASIVWAWLVQWRVGRHQAAIWKSLVLPAGGATLCWLLLMTLWMPLLDFVRSYELVTARVQAQVGPRACLQVRDLNRDQIAALRYHGGFALVPASTDSPCAWLVVDPELLSQRQDPIDTTVWKQVAAIERASGKGDELQLYRRITP